jgi:3-phenylpropionate/trans-cinnamate dioxygenase ferredoxin subunit
MFVPVAKTSEIPDPGKLLVEVDDCLVVIVHCEGKFYAIDDVCTHDGGPLGEGKLEGCTIACPRHGAKFDVRTGAALTMPATKPTGTHEVKIEGDRVLVQLAD